MLLILLAAVGLWWWWPSDGPQVAAPGGASSAPEPTASAQDPASSQGGRASSPSAASPNGQSPAGQSPAGQSPAAGTYSAIPIPVRLGADGASGRANRLSIGERSACVVAEDGVPWCWGSNDAGQLGSPGGDSTSPRRVDVSGALKGRKLGRISVAVTHACGLDEAGRAYCWGSNSDGQLGVGQGVDRSPTPIPVDASGVLRGKELVLIGTGRATTCALDTVGRLYCWGSNKSGQFGNGSTSGSDRPIAVDTSGALDGRAITRYSVGEDHVCAIDADQIAYCWGANDRGQLGTGNNTPSLVPVRVSSAGAIPQGQFAAISLGGSTTCAWTAAGTVACWGANDHGQLGTGSTADANLAQGVRFPGSGAAVSRINVGGDSVCATTTGGQAFCWGANGQGQVGDGTTTDRTRPVRVLNPKGAGLPPLDRIGTGSRTACGLGTNGTTWCWGSDENGMLANG